MSAAVALAVAPHWGPLPVPQPEPVEPRPPIDLPDGVALALAAQQCPYCHGLGRVPGWGQTGPPRMGQTRSCSCVERRVFRTCLKRYYRERERSEKGGTRIVYRWRGGLAHFSRPSEEYQADFVLVARRVLGPRDFRIFGLYHLMGATYAAGAPLDLDRGDFFHRVYRIEALLGRAFFALQPYPLFPLHRYFGGGHWH